MWFNCSDCEEDFEVTDQDIVVEILEQEYPIVCNFCSGYDQFIDCEGNFTP